MSNTIIYGIKNCDTVKKARKWLEQQGVDYHFHDFRTHGLDEAQVQTWLKQLGIEALINKRSTTWKGLTDSEQSALLNTNAAAAIISQNPTLIKRPLLVTGSHIGTGFKAPEYAALFEK